MPELHTPIKNLLRPRQVQEAKDELRRIDDTLNSPPHIRSKISDPRMMAARRHRLREELDEYTPKPYAEHEKDAAVKRRQQLAEEIKSGMPSDEVMRRNPPGAVAFHQAWERKNKKNVLEWKHIGLRLHASGDLHDTLGEAAVNVETLRKHSSGFDLAMDGAQIPKKTDFHIPPKPDSVVFGDAEIKALEEVKPDLANKLAMMDADTRRSIKGILERFFDESAPVAEAPKPEPAVVKKKPLNPGMQRMANLRALCKREGINSWGMKTEKMVEALKAKGVAAE